MIVSRFAYPLNNAVILEHLTTDLTQSVLLQDFILDGTVLHIIPLDIIFQALICPTPEWIWWLRLWCLTARDLIYALYVSESNPH
jgi:hypothetical protein